MKVKLEMGSTEALLRRHGLQEGGPVQQFVDNNVMRRMEPYMPQLTGNLIKSMEIGTVIGSGEINIPGPYAHYLNEGIVYIDPKYNCAGWISNTPGQYFGQWFSRKGSVKVPTDRELQFGGGSLRGKKFFDRMKSDHKDDILRETQEYIDNGGFR